MATNKNITMKQFNGVDYDTLYPKTIASQIDDVYSKDETSNLFLPKAGGSMGGILDMNGNRITNLPTPTSNSDPATKEYVDGKTNKKLVKTIIVNETIAASSSKIVALQNPIDFDTIDGIGIRMTFNDNLNLVNNSARYDTTFEIKFCNFYLCYRKLYSNSSVRYVSAGNSIFVPIFMYPGTGLASGENTNGKNLFPSYGEDTSRLLSFFDTTKDQTISIYGGSYSGGMNTNITFNIYELYF
mgnify:CR=1 FL=1